jgi:putative membrane protein
VVQYLWGGDFKVIAGMGTKDMAPIVSQSPVIIVALAVILIGLFAFFAVLMRMV